MQGWDYRTWDVWGLGLPVGTRRSAKKIMIHIYIYNIIYIYLSRSNVPWHCSAGAATCQHIWVMTEEQEASVKASAGKVYFNSR
jgi:hypothetical protein